MITVIPPTVHTIQVHLRKNMVKGIDTKNQNARKRIETETEIEIKGGPKRERGGIETVRNTKSDQKKERGIDMIQVMVHRCHGREAGAKAETDRYRQSDVKRVRKIDQRRILKMLWNQ